MSETRDWVARADAHADAREWNEALACLREALAALGSDYRSDGLKDSTGLKVLIAEDQAAAGEMEAAFANLRSVAQDRIGAFRARHQGERTAQDPG